MNLPYSRQLNRPIRYFKYFTMLDIFAISVSTIVVPQIFGVTFLAILLVIWFIYNLAFRIGRPAGYGPHFFKSLFRSDHYNAGRGQFRKMVRRQW